MMITLITKAIHTSLLAAGLLSINLFANQDEYFEGEYKKINGFKIETSKRTIEIPSFVKIILNGNVVYSDSSTLPIIQPIYNIEYAKIGKMLFIKSVYNDHVDIVKERLFILDSIDNIHIDTIWTSNWIQGFYIKDEKIEFWSEWFCSSKEIIDGKSYVYVLNKKRMKFMKETRNYEENCNEKDKQFIKFTNADEVEKTGNK